MKIAFMQQEQLNLGKFQIAEISRVRGAVTTGNVVGYLGRCVTKLEYIEQRSQSFNGFFDEFWMHLKQDVTQERWYDHEHGFAALAQMIEQFVYVKFTKIGPNVEGNLSAEIAEFKNKIKQKVLEEQAKTDQYQQPFHWQWLDACATQKIDEIFQKNSQFSDRCAFMWKV